MISIRWVLGAVGAGLILSAGSAGAAPLALSPMVDDSVQMVQFFFDEPPPPVYYAPPPPPVYYEPPPPRYYDDYPPPRRGYYPPPGAYYGPPRGRGGPPPYRYAEPRVQPRPANPGRPPQIYTKQQVRAWNRANGF
jgi:hypothetical protein